MTPSELGRRMTLAEFQEIVTIYALEHEEFEANKPKKGGKR